MKLRTKALQAEADAEVAGTVHSVAQAEALLATVRAQLDATPHDATGRERLEARSRALCEFLRQTAPQSAALKPRCKPIKLTGPARLNELEAEVERERVFATCTDLAVELPTVRDEIAVVGRQIAAAQADEATATGAALKAAEARSLALIRKRDKLAHRSRALCELMRATRPSHPDLQVGSRL